MERNRQMNTIQSSRQLIVELSEKVRILESEIEVLRKQFETVSMEQKLQKNRIEDAHHRRNNLKKDLSKAETGFTETEKQIDLQAATVRRLQETLVSVEDIISHQQSRYESHARDCAEVQRLLLDKQDALCLLNEQLNRHAAVMRSGEVVLQQREREVNILRTHLRGFHRKIESVGRKFPQIIAYSQEIRELRSSIEDERVFVFSLKQKLEIPELEERQKRFCGKDVSNEYLDEKIARYEQRINDREQTIWEKQILLKELSDKISKLLQITDLTGKSKRLERVAQQRLEAMALRRRKKAALSEISVYKAQADVIGEQRENATKEMELANGRLEKGKEFDNISGRIIRMHKRDVASANAARRRVEETEQPPGRPHFDAYPTADGLSRPYGGFPIFQPFAAPGYTRHYKKETEKPVFV